MYYHFKNLPISINGNQIIANAVELSHNIDLIHPLNHEEQSSEKDIINGQYQSDLKLTYYLTGNDYLKSYIYSDGNSPINCNFAGISFQQGYLKSYSINTSPGSPIQVNTDIQFFDKPNGILTQSNYINFTGQTLKISDVKINNYSNYTINLLNSILSLSFNYQANFQPSYKITDVDSPPSNANRVSFGERSISMSISSDDINLSLPLSGENFAIKTYFVNPFNTGIYETIECSGKINNKSIQLNTNDSQIHNIQISQSHLNNNAEITGVITGISNLTIRFTENHHPITSFNNLNYISKIFVGDTECQNYIINRQINYDEIIINNPTNISDGLLEIQTTKKNYIWPNIIHFTSQPITLYSLSNYSGINGNPIYITGNNFYKISDVYFRDKRATFQTIDTNNIISIVPYGETTGPLQVISIARNQTGILSNQLFYGVPFISDFNPKTGYWGNSITMSGYNLSGITGIYFNNIRASGNFIISNDNILIANSPQTGAGYAGGYITILGSGGLGTSLSLYYPSIILYNFEPLTGSWGNLFTGRLKIDTDYLCPSGDGYKVKIGGINTKLSIMNTGTLTGIIPSGALDDYIYYYTPDGQTTYDPYNIPITTSTNVVINSINPSTLYNYGRNSLNINGINFKNFDNNSYILYSGELSHETGIIYYPLNFNINSTLDTISTSTPLLTGTGYYSITLTNKYSNSIVRSGINLVQSNHINSGNLWITTTTYIENGVKKLRDAPFIQGDKTRTYFRNNNPNNSQNYNAANTISPPIQFTSNAINSTSNLITFPLYLMDNDKSTPLYILSVGQTPHISIEPDPVKNQYLSASAMLFVFYNSTTLATSSPTHPLNHTGLISVWSQSGTSQTNIFKLPYNFTGNSIGRLVFSNPSATGYINLIDFGTKINNINAIRIYGDNSNNTRMFTISDLKIY